MGIPEVKKNFETHYAQIFLGTAELRSQNFFVSANAAFEAAITCINLA
jgi:hypothetical protein